MLKNTKTFVKEEKGGIIMVEFGPETLKAGLPIVKEAPNCARCHGPKAFVVSMKYGIICGHCVESIDKESRELNEFMIREARQKLEVQNGRKTMSPLQE